MMNKTLLSKWNRRFANDKGAFWKKVIINKYGEKDGGWRSKEVDERYSIGICKSIEKELKLPKWQNFFLSGKFSMSKILEG